MRLFVVAACLALAAPAAAETVKPKPAPKPEKAEKADQPSATPAKQECKRKIIGKGLERKVIYECESAIVVSSQAPRPNVIIVQQGGRKVTGRPKLTDPLAGLRQLEK